MTLDGSGSSDADGDSLTYSWTINGHAGAATGVSPTLTWAQLHALGVDNGPPTFTVQLQVDDGHGSVGTNSTTLTLNNTPPTAGIRGPSDGYNGVRGQARTFTVTASGRPPGRRPVCKPAPAVITVPRCGTTRAVDRGTGRRALCGAREGHAGVAEVGRVRQTGAATAARGPTFPRGRRRAESLLAKLERVTPQQLQQVRAVAVLEYIGTPEARRLLQKLAQGAPGPG